jgi:hypothetical protein
MAGPCRIPKLTVQVRFPSPAPHAKSVGPERDSAIGDSPRTVALIPEGALGPHTGHKTFTSAPVFRPQMDAQPVIHRGRNGGVGLACGVLVDQRGSRAVVTHAGHQVLEAGARRSRQDVAGVPQVVCRKRGITIMFLGAADPEKYPWAPRERSFPCKISLFTKVHDRRLHGM